MPISLSQVAMKTRTVTIELDGEEMNVTYRPSVYTAEFEARVTQLVNKNGASGLGVASSELISDWDLFEDDAHKKKVPITAERIATLPIIVIGRVLDAIGGDLRPTLRRSSPSADGSLV